MAGKFKLTSYLWLIVACLLTASSLGSPQEGLTTSQPTEETTSNQKTTTTTTGTLSTTITTAGTSSTATTTAGTPSTTTTTAGTPSTTTTTAGTPSTTTTTAGTPSTTTTTAGTSSTTATTAGTPSTTTTPGTSSTTTTPGTSSTTTTAGTSLTTTTPGTSSTATTPGTSSTTTTPGTPSTATTPGTSSTTTTPGTPSTATTTAGTPSTATTTAGTPSTATTTAGTSSTATTDASSKPPPGPCQSAPCGDGSTCEDHGHDFVCLCLPGDNYNYVDKRCETAKVFPGDLSLPELKFEEGMETKGSSQFKEAAKKINAEMEKIFNTMGYLNSTVLELRRIQKGRADEGVNASVDIVFKTSADVSTSDINKAFETAASGTGLLAGADFTDTPVCERNPCDMTTTNCTAVEESFICTCLSGFIKTNFTSRQCTACPSGKQAENSECIDCPYGYSGFNCSENWKLVLVIVGSVLGGLLIIALIVLSVVSLKFSKKNSKKSKTEDIGKPYISHSSAKAPLVTEKSGLVNSLPTTGSFFTGMPRIPRAATPNNWESRTNLEMTPSNSRQNLTSRQNDSQDNMDLYSQTRPQGSLYAQNRPQNNPYAQSRPQSNPYAQSRPQSNPYAQSRPQSNPYAQSRPQNNPYAQNFGQTNPSYVHDNGRY